MSDSTPEGSLPPEVPEEFAAAYRAAYERALAEQSEGIDAAAPEPAPAPSREKGSEDTDELPARQGRLVVGTHRTEEYDEQPTVIQRITDSAWFVPLLLALLAALMILGAYAIGRAFSGQVDEESGSSSATSEQRAGVVTSAAPGSKPQPVSRQKPAKGAWDGAVKPIGDVEAEAECTAKPSKDASGRPVSYEAANLTDGIADTTWRCAGKAKSVTIALTLPDKVAIGEVGLIPGYAKTDEKSGADRYAQNNRVTRVRWTIGDTDVVQKLDGSAEDRSLRLMRVPRTETDEVTLEILKVKKGPRNTTAISEILLGGAG